MKRQGARLTAPPSKRPALSQAQSQEVKRQVARQIARNKDYKQAYSDQATTFSYSGTVYDLFTNLARGDNATNSIEGSKLIAKNVKVRVQVAAADLSNAFRCIIFQWNDASTPGVTGVLSPNIISSTSAPFAYRNWTNRHLYTILADVQGQTTANPNAGGGNGPVVNFVMYYKGRKLRPTYFASTSATIQKGGIYLLVVSDSSAVSHPGILFTSEIVYTDE